MSSTSSSSDSGESDASSGNVRRSKKTPTFPRPEVVNADLPEDPALDIVDNPNPPQGGEDENPIETDVAKPEEFVFELSRNMLLGESI